MDYQFTEADNAFRSEVVDFIDNNWVPASGPEVEGDDSHFIAERAFEKRAASKGWLTMAWPEEYGGRGASHIQQMIYREEAAYRGAPGSGGQGISMVGPCLMLHGTEEQRQEHLPRIANAESYWAQGFSEPGNGSDLAGLQTRAVRDGDDFVINGQKIWTSGAHYADWIHVLTRTDPEAPKHRGISYFLLDMNTPGIEVRPLINMLGEHGFNEVYFTDVRVPAANMMGEYNRGWYVAATLLDFERSGVAWSATSRKSVELMSEYAAEKPGRRGGAKLIDDPGVRNGLANLMIESEIAKLISYRVVLDAVAGIGPESRGVNVEDVRLRAGPARLSLRRQHDGPAQSADRPRRSRRPARRPNRPLLHVVRPQHDRGRHVRDSAQHHRHPRPAASEAVVLRSRKGTDSSGPEEAAAVISSYSERAPLSKSLTCSRTWPTATPSRTSSSVPSTPPADRVGCLSSSSSAARMASIVSARLRRNSVNSCSTG